jgi:hypothetical protein
VSEEALQVLRDMCPPPGGKLIIPLREQPILELAPGIKARVAKIIPDPDALTCAGSLKVAGLMGLHKDLERMPDEELPISIHDTERRRGLVVLDAPHTSLFVRGYNLFDIAERVAPGNPDYIPRDRELIPVVGELIRDKEQIVAVEMREGEGVAFSAANTFHDGKPNEGRNKAHVVVTYELEEGWNDEALLENSLFK